MPNTYGGAISQGIQQGIQNVSALIGVMANQQKMTQDAALFQKQMQEYDYLNERVPFESFTKLLDAGEEGDSFARAYAGAIGIVPEKSTRKDMMRLQDAFKGDNQAAQAVLQMRIRNYQNRIATAEKPEEKSKWQAELDNATILNKNWLDAQKFRATQAEQQKILQMMPQVEANPAGYHPMLVLAAQTKSPELFAKVVEKLATEAKTQQKSDMEKYVEATPEQRTLMGEFKGLGKESKAPSPSWHTVEDSKSSTGFSYQNLNDPKAPLVKNAPKPRSEKPEYTAKQAMLRVSQIDMAIAKLKTSGTVSQEIAIQNPLLAQFINMTDPKAVAQAIATLEAEKEEVLRYVPETYKRIETKPPASVGAKEYIDKVLKKR